MKKLFCILALCASLASCRKDAPEPPVIQHQTWVGVRLLSRPDWVATVSVGGQPVTVDAISAAPPTDPPMPPDYIVRWFAAPAVHGDTLRVVLSYVDPLLTPANVTEMSCIVLSKEGVFSESVVHQPAELVGETFVSLFRWLSGDPTPAEGTTYFSAQGESSHAPARTLVCVVP